MSYTVTKQLSQQSNTIWMAKGDQLRLKVGDEQVILNAVQSCTIGRDDESIWQAVEDGLLIPHGMNRFEWEMRKAARITIE